MTRREGEVERQIMAAIERLRSGTPQYVTEVHLTDRNVIAEARTSKATFYRCAKGVAEWRKVKEAAVCEALGRLESLAAQGQEPTEASLLAIARVDRGALRTMPEELQRRWQLLQRPRTGPQATSKDELIASLVAKLYATSLAVRKRDEIIAQQAAQIAELGGKITPLRPV
jgi:hypothetical protein